MTKAPTVTLAMFWPLLMQAAGNEYNPNAQTALVRLQARTSLDVDKLYAEDVAEEMAREHFPSGTTQRAVAVGFYTPNEGWVDDRDMYDTFEEMLNNLEEAGPLSSSDPVHVAMVIRILALSQGLPVYVEGPNVKFKHYDTYQDADDIDCGPGVMISLDRTRPSSGPVSVGYFIPYQSGESAKNLDVGAAIFRWMAERHAEIVTATKAQDEAESDPANVIELRGA